MGNTLKNTVVLMMIMLLALSVLTACGDDEETLSPTLTPTQTASPTVERTETSEPMADGVFFIANHGQDYAATTWSAVHGDSRNSDYVPVVTSSNVEVKWHVLEGAIFFAPPTVGPEGNVYVLSGRGKGTSALHAFDRDGNLLWESEPYNSIDDLDSLAEVSSPTIDTDGDLYVSDLNQLWAFHSDGTVKWVTDLAAHNVSGPFVSCILTGGFVGGIGVNGQVMLVNHDDGSLAVPVLDLPGGASPPGILPPGLWEGGLIDPERRQMIWDILRGYIYEVANTPAVHPETGRIYILGAGRTEEEGNFYGIDLIDGQLEIAFETKVSAGSGTSPTLSNDSAIVYAAGGDGVMYALDSMTGDILWAEDLGTAAASPAVGPDGTLYSLSVGRLVAMNPNGTVKWSRNYDSLADDRLDLVPAEGIIETGIPAAFVDSAVSISAKKLWFALVLGYKATIGEFVFPSQTILVAASPENGDIIAVYDLPESCEAIASIDANGQLYVTFQTITSSIMYHGGFNDMVPPDAQIKTVPRGGIMCFGPVSQTALAIEGIEWVQELMDVAIEDLNQNDGQSAESEIQKAHSQLGAAAVTIQGAITDGEISQSRGESAHTVIMQSVEDLAYCLDVLTSEMSVTELEDCIDLVESVRIGLDDVQAELGRQ